jgi:hypothetical protein
MEEGEIESKNFRDFLAIFNLTKDEVVQAIEDMDR